MKRLYDVLTDQTSLLSLYTGIFLFYWAQSKHKQTNSKKPRENSFLVGKFKVI